LPFQNFFGLMGAAYQTVIAIPKPFGQMGASYTTLIDLPPLFSQMVTPCNQVSRFFQADGGTLLYMILKDKISVPVFTFFNHIF
jgi:hypothetical protein